MRFLMIVTMLILSQLAFGKIQKQGIKTASDCTAAGAALSNCLPDDTQVWVSSVVPAQQLSTAITAGLIGGGGGNSGKNYITNAGFEAATPTGWTIAGATNAVNTSDFHDGVQALTLTPTGAGSILQSVTPAPNLYGSNLESGMWVKTTKTDVSVCSLASGSEVECQAAPATGNWIYVPANQSGPVQGQTIGVKVKWASTGGTVIVDQSYVGGATNISLQNLQNTFSAKVSSVGVVSDENTDFINGDCTNPTTGHYVCTFKSGVFTASPNCVITGNYTLTSSGNIATNPVSSTSVSYETVEAGSFADRAVNLVCTKSVDNQMAVNSLKSDYGLTAWTPTFTTVTPSVVEMYHSKQGEFLYIQGKIVHTGGTGALTFTLPGSLVIGSKVTAASNYQVVGTGAMTTSTVGSLTVLGQAGLSTLVFGADGFAGGGMIPYTGAWGAETMTFFVKVPIDGWTDSQRAPTLAGSVTSGSGSALRFEGANINNTNGSSTVNSSTSSWITTSSCSAAGKCTYNLIGFSATPYCTCSTNHVAASICSAVNTTSTTTEVYTQSLSVYADENQVKITCMGAR